MKKRSFNKFIRWILLSQISLSRISSGWVPINLGMLLSARNLSFMFKQSFTTMHYDSSTRLEKLVYARSNASIIKLRRGISIAEEGLGGYEQAFIPPLEGHADISASRRSAI